MVHSSFADQDAEHNTHSYAVKEAYKTVLKKKTVRPRKVNGNIERNKSYSSIASM